MTTEEVNCNICGKKTETGLWASGKSKRNPEDSTVYNIVQCKKCGLIYTNPRFTLEKLKEYYSKNYVDNRVSTAGKNKKRYDMYLIEVKQTMAIIKENFGNETIKFLDSGCSNGLFLQAMPEKGIKKYATEFSEDAAEVAKNNAKIKKMWIGDLTEIDFGEQRFDVVHMRAILEHVRDPKKVLKKAHSILTDRGVLILSSTPNAGSFVARLYKYRWALTKPEEHIYYYTDRTINTLFKQTGFRRFKTYHPYVNTPYSNLLKDHFDFIWNYITKKESPPFWASVFTIYARKREVRVLAGTEDKVEKATKELKEKGILE